ncbi:hypothetical protein KIH75_04240 [Bifidobacterium sp. 64T4]|uniref:hypothetical protein n=1 Tax=Bifidobacterium pongonis TaxID=2834432 RepID=UPI001C55B80B|nr:hypothetical protein [Bifidobacterium pongonis]MBW3094563.1 hypothetical protein [Bifidobacterium pongonis]
MSEEQVDKTSENKVADQAVGAKRGKRGVITAGVVAAIVLAGAGAYGWNAWNGHQLNAAKTDCAAASESLRIAMNEYSALVNGDAAEASDITAKQVSDAKTVDALAKALRTEEPEVAACIADDKAGYEERTAAVNSNTAWYAKHKVSLAKAVKAVEKSRDAKTIADAEKLLKDSKGKVADEKTRTALDKAIKAKDVDAVAKAVKAVNDSVKAKEKADAQAKAEAEAAARAAQAQAQAVQAQAQSQGYSGGSQSGGSYSGGGYAGSGSQSGGSAGGNAGSGASGGAANGGGEAGSGGSGSGSGGQWISGCEVTLGNGRYEYCEGGDVWF